MSLNFHTALGSLFETKQQIIKKPILTVQSKNM